MPKAKPPTTTRRHLSGASAAMLLIACPAAGALKATEMDGSLLAACDRFHAANRAAYRHSIDTRCDGAPGAGRAGGRVGEARGMSARRSTPPAPPVLPKSAKEQAQDQATLALLRETIVIVKQQNLDRVVILAEMARRHQLPQELQDHFGELGRRYAELVTNRGKRKSPALRVVEGGAA